MCMCCVRLDEKEKEINLKSHLSNQLPSDSRTADENRGRQPERSASNYPDSFLGPAECLKAHYTQMSCAKTLCPLGYRCQVGEQECTCDNEPEKCYIKKTVCSRDLNLYDNQCYAVAESCRTKIPVFSHHGTECECETQAHIERTHSHKNEKKSFPKQ